MKPTSVLTPRQARFVAAYRKSRNASAAAIVAGYTANKQSSKVIGCRLVKQLNLAEQLATADTNSVDLVTSDEGSTVPVVQRKPGQRPMPLTRELSDRICESIANGCSLSLAAQLAHISMDTLQRWRKKGSEGLEPYATFSDRFQDAEAKCQEALIRIWKEAAPNDWRAAKDFLARRWPRDYSDHAGRFAVFGADGFGAANQRGSLFNIVINRFPRWYHEQRIGGDALKSIDVVSKPVPPKNPNSDLN